MHNTFFLFHLVSSPLTFMTVFPYVTIHPISPNLSTSSTVNSFVDLLHPLTRSNREPLSRKVRLLCGPLDYWSLTTPSPFLIIAHYNPSFVPWLVRPGVTDDISTTQNDTLFTFGKRPVNQFTQSVGLNTNVSSGAQLSTCTCPCEFSSF